MNFACCFAGHRVMDKSAVAHAWEQLNLQIEEALRDGCRYFACGFAPGADLLFAELVLARKAAHPDLVLQAVLPGAEALDRVYGDARFRRLIAGSDSLTLLSAGAGPGDPYRLCRCMVDGADRVIALYDGRGEGGTYYTVHYARRREKDLRIIQLPAVIPSGPPT